jgi:hypothetical protein
MGPRSSEPGEAGGGVDDPSEAVFPIGVVDFLQSDDFLRSIT